MVPPPSTSISMEGMTASMPPSGSTPPSTSRDAEPMRYAPQPMIRQNTVEMTVPRLMAAVSLMA